MNVLPAGWKQKRIGEIAVLNPRRPRELRELPGDYPVTFVEMAAVESATGTIANPAVRPFAEIRKGFTYFRENDVIFAKITPCMQNGKSAIARGLSNGLGMGSTEFHVLRPSENEVLPEWIWHFVRQPSLLSEATRHFRGAVGQQRVPAGFLAKHLIPVPPLDEQRRIVDRIDEAMDSLQEILKLHSQRLEALVEMKRSLVLGLVPGDQIRRPLGELVDWIRETEPATPGDTYYFAGVKSFGRGVFHSATRTTADFKYSSLRRLKHRDFIYPKLMAWEGAFGMVPMELDGFVASPEFVVFRPKDDAPICAEVLDTYFRSPFCIDDVRDASTGTNKRRRRLNPKPFLTLGVPIPSLENQAKLKSVYRFSEKAEAEWRGLQGELNRLRAAVLRTAFIGEL